MGKASADVKLTVTQRAAIQALDQFQRRFESMTGRMQKAVEKTARSSQQLNSQFGKMPAVLTRALSGVVLFNEALSMGKRMAEEYMQSFTEIARKAEEARMQKVSYQEYLKQAYEILPRSSDVSIEQIDKMLRGAGTSSPKNLARATMAAISATSELPVSERVKTVTELGQIRPDLLKSFPGAFEDLVKTVVSGKARLKDVRNTTYAQMGMMNLGQSVSAVTDPRLYARNIAPLGYQLRDYGVNQGEAFAMASSIGLATGESEGQITRTGILNLFKILTVEAKKAGVDKKGMDLLEYIAFSKEGKAKTLQNTLLNAFSEDKDFLEAQRALASMGKKNALKSPQVGQRAKTFLPVIDLLQGNTGAGSTWEGISTALDEMQLTKTGKYRADMGASYVDVDRFYRKKAKESSQKGIFSALYQGERGGAFLAESQLENTRGQQAKFLKDIIDATIAQGIPDPGIQLPFTSFPNSFRGQADRYAAGTGPKLSETQLLRYAMHMMRTKEASLLYGEEMADGRKLNKQNLTKWIQDKGITELLETFKTLNETQVSQLQYLENIEQKLQKQLEEAQKTKKVKVDNLAGIGAAVVNPRNLQGGEK